MNFLVIGNGLIGAERIKALTSLKNEGFDIGNIFVYDIDSTKELPVGVQYAKEDTFKELPPDWVFIATPNYAAKDWAKVAISWGSKILIEKPFGMCYQEAIDIYNSLQYPEQLYAGFNYRFYNGVLKMRQDFLEKKFGDIISINMTLAHGGRPDNKTSWLFNPFLGVPDPLLDLGIHFFDLLNFITGSKDIIPLYGKSWKGFWNTGILEEIHLFLKANDFIINSQFSFVRWRSTFEIFINGTEGYGILNGKGRSFGIQTYVTGKRWGWIDGKKQKDTENLEVITECKNSFYSEVKHLFTNPIINCTASDALSTMKLYDECLRVIR